MLRIIAHPWYFLLNAVPAAIIAVVGARREDKEGPAQLVQVFVNTVRSRMSENWALKHGKGPKPQ